MNRRHVIAALTATASSATAGCLADITDEFTGPSTEDVKQNAESIQYEELYRNISEYEGDPVTYSDVEITDIPKSEDGHQEYILKLATANRENGHYLYGDWDGDPFKEDDLVTVWGTVEGTTTYLTLAGEQTVPEIDIVDLQLEQ